MAGHSKWANIKHRKGAADARKSKLFSKLAKYILVAARNGGGNPQENLKLRYAIEKARAASMPKDSIERAIKKGTGALQGEGLTEITYEGIGPEGISVIIEVLTDNRNRTGGEVRNLLEKRGGQLTKSNSVMWKFERKGVLGISKEDVGEEELFEHAIEAGADNIEDTGPVFEVYTCPDEFDRVRADLQSFLEGKRGAGAQKRWGESEDTRPIFTRTDLVYVPQNPLVITDVQKARAALTFLEDIEDHEDVQGVFSDLEVPDAVLEAMSVES
jgi:YebC/PmpR family DNA-binding regulatory protein